MNKKIAIIGGGIAGLSCLHELKKANIEVDLYEKNEKVGGRIATFHDTETKEFIEMGAGYFHEHYTGLIQLLSELNLTEKIIPRRKMGAAFVMGQEAISLKPFSLLLAFLKKKLNFADLNSLIYLKKISKKYCHDGQLAASKFYEETFQFPLDETQDILELCSSNPELLKNGNKSFTDFYPYFSHSIIDHLIKPLFKKQLFQNPEEMSYFLGAAALGSSQLSLYTLKGGLETLPKKLYEIYQENIILNTEIKNMSAPNNKIINNYDIIISAIPLSQLTQIYPEFTSPIQYTETNIFILKGKLKKHYDKGDSLFIKNTGHGMDGISRYGKNLFKISSKLAKPNFNEFFTHYQILHQKKWDTATPIHLPGLKFSFYRPQHNIYCIGDYIFLSMEGAIATGIKTAQHIKRSL